MFPVFTTVLSCCCGLLSWLTVLRCQQSQTGSSLTSPLSRLPTLPLLAPPRACRTHPCCTPVRCASDRSNKLLLMADLFRLVSCPRKSGPLLFCSPSPAISRPSHCPCAGPLCPSPACPGPPAAASLLCFNPAAAPSHPSLRYSPANLQQIYRPVMVIPSIECDDHLPVPPLAQGDVPWL